MKIVGIIPARMAASRFPGKPLAPLAGRPMIEHVYRRAERCPHLAEVHLATCDREIYDAVQRFGGKAIMTADTHVRCTDRVAEAAQAISADVIVNIQGDEPLIHPQAITQLCEAILADPEVPCVNLCNVITQEADFRNPNQIKAVCDQSGCAIYMSRQPIPTTKQWGQTQVLRQLGMIAFRKGFLETFTRLKPTPPGASRIGGHAPRHRARVPCQDGRQLFRIFRRGHPRRFARCRRVASDRSDRRRDFRHRVAARSP